MVPRNKQKRSMGDADRLKWRDIYKIARSELKLLANYVLHTEVSYLIVCTMIEAESYWTVVKVKVRIITYLNKLGQDKYDSLA